MLLTVILIIFATILGFLYFLFKRNFSYWTRFPAVPRADGKIFNNKFLDIITFKTNFGYHLKDIYGDENFRNAPVVGIYGLYKPALLLREPNIIKSVLIKNFDCFKNRFCRGDVHNDPTGAMTLFFSTNNDWRETRLKLNSAFSSGKLKFMYPLLQKVGNRLEDYLQQRGERFTLEVKDTCGRYTTEVISTTLMGFSSNALENGKEHVYQEAVKLSMFNLKRAIDFVVLFFAPKLNRLLRPRVFYASTEQFMRSSIQRVMEEREQSVGLRHDLIDIFIKIKQDAEEKCQNMQKCQDNLIAQSCVLMLGGYESSTSTMANVLFELSRDLQVQTKLRNEICHTLEKENGYISYEVLTKMVYLQMVVDEILRLYPVLPYLERDCNSPSNRDFQFSLEPYYDYKLPSGMPIYISVFGLHYDPKYWPNPTKFDPERFSPARKKLLKPMTYLPFGDGPRKCIGARLAILDVKVGLIYFLKNHQVRVCSKTILKPIIEPKSIFLQTKGGTHLEFLRDNLFENIKLGQ